MATRNLYLIRHGEYHWSEENPELNEHLTDKGREQARIVGKALAERLPWIDKIYTSNMHRAQETTEEILTMIPPVKVLRCSMHQVIISHRRLLVDPMLEGALSGDHKHRYEMLHPDFVRSFHPISV